MCNTCGCRAAEEINPIDSVIVEAPLGRGVAQFYAEGGEMATYSPSREPDMASPATEPTNANFSAEDLFCASCGSYKRAEGHGCGCMGAEDNKRPIYDINWDTDDGEGGEIIPMDGMGNDLPSTVMVPSDLEEDEIADYLSDNYGWLVLGFTMGAESKSMFGKDKNGKMYARRRNGRIITHNAESDVECITCASDMSDQPLWGCECCGMLVGTKGDHEGCGFNEDGEVLCNLCYMGQCDCESFGAESKSMFGKDKNGKMYARRRNGRIITHNAEHEGLYACSKCKHWNRNPVDGITKCKKCGNGTFTFVKRSEFMPEGDGNVVGQQTFTYNGTPLRAEEETSFGLVGEGNDFGQMRAEEVAQAVSWEGKGDNNNGLTYGIEYLDEDGMVADVEWFATSKERDGVLKSYIEEFGSDFVMEKPFTTGAKLSAGLLTGAALFGLVGASLTALLGSIMERGE
jgi:nitrous oxide reductase accessory protein NosL